MTIYGSTGTGRWPVHGWTGICLVGLFWPLNWLLPGFRTHLFFFPLWLGYILTVDALVFHRTARSLLARAPWTFAALFPISSIFWWFFELINRRTGNWEYLGREHFSDLEYALLASIAFSTVVPAVFETAELLFTLLQGSALSRGPELRSSGLGRWGSFLAGMSGLLLTLLYPRFFFPLVWIAPYFIVSALNEWLGYRTLSANHARGDWRPTASLALGALVCGFFWEMWNVLSYPKWIYHIPYVGFARIFEMPILGYFGYLPFALELYVFYHFISGLLGGRLEHSLFFDESSPSRGIHR